MPGDILFDSEGGFRVPRPDGTYFHVPAEQAKKVWIRFTDVAREYDDYGIDRPHGTTLDALIREWDRLDAKWTRLDRLNLTRIAKASEDNCRAIRSLAAEAKRLNKELKDMMGFWKDLRSEYRRNRGEE